MRNILLLFFCFFLSISTALAQERPVEEPSGLREAFIDGWPWVVFLLCSGIIAGGLYVYKHTGLVSNLAITFPNNKRGAAEWYSLHFWPALWGILSAFLLMGLAYFFAYLVAFEKDFKALENEAAKPWGKPYTFVWTSLATAFFVILICYILGCFFKKKVDY